MSDGLLRISEVTELRIDDLEDNTLRLRFSKTDQEGQGEHLYLCEDTRKIVAENGWNGRNCRKAICFGV